MVFMHGTLIIPMANSVAAMGEIEDCFVTSLMHCLHSTIISKVYDCKIIATSSSNEEVDK